MIRLEELRYRQAGWALKREINFRKVKEVCPVTDKTP
jgi:hypothetical protein